MRARVDHAQYQPTDRHIEDRVAVVRDDARVVVGVFDGHGGSATAEYLKENLPGRVLDEIPPEVKSGLAAEQFASLFERFDEEMLSDFRKDFKSLLRVPGEALRRWRIGNKLSDGEVLARAQRVKSGSTALIAYVEGSRLFVANAGDCRAVLGRLESTDFKIIGPHQLTIDLNAENEEERARIRLSHPGEDHVITGTRVLGQIGVTRAFGDAFYKLKDTRFTDQVFAHQLMTSKGKLSMRETHGPYYHLIQSPPYLVPTPEVTSLDLWPEDVFLVLASDGLWDTEGVTNEWVVQTVLQGLTEKPLNIAKYLLERVHGVGRPGDDVTIAIIVFNHSEGD